MEGFYELVATLPKSGNSLRISGRTASRTAPTLRRSSKGGLRQAAACAGAVAIFAAGCVCLNIYGCMNLDAAAASRAHTQSALARMERANLRLQSQIDSLAHPDRLSTVAKASGMMPVEPSKLISCPPPARMAKAVDTLSGM